MIIDYTVSLKTAAFAQLLSGQLIHFPWLYIWDTGQTDQLCLGYKMFIEHVLGTPMRDTDAARIPDVCICR